jgi:hypothetical protein
MEEKNIKTEMELGKELFFLALDLEYKKNLLKKISDRFNIKIKDFCYRDQINKKLPISLVLNDNDISSWLSKKELLVLFMCSFLNTHVNNRKKMFKDEENPVSSLIIFNKSKKINFTPDEIMFVLLAFVDLEKNLTEDGWSPLMLILAANKEYDLNIPSSGLRYIIKKSNFKQESEMGMSPISIIFKFNKDSGLNLSGDEIMELFDKSDKSVKTRGKENLPMIFFKFRKLQELNLTDEQIKKLITECPREVDIIGNNELMMAFQTISNFSEKLYDFLIDLVEDHKINDVVEKIINYSVVDNKLLTINQILKIFNKYMDQYKQNKNKIENMEVHKYVEDFLNIVNSYKKINKDVNTNFEADSKSIVKI